MRDRGNQGPGRALLEGGGEIGIVPHDFKKPYFNQGGQGMPATLLLYHLRFSNLPTGALCYVST